MPPEEKTKPNGKTASKQRLRLKDMQKTLKGFNEKADPACLKHYECKAHLEGKGIREPLYHDALGSLAGAIRAFDASLPLANRRFEEKVDPFMIRTKRGTYKLPNLFYLNDEVPVMIAVCSYLDTSCARPDMRVAPRTPKDMYGRHKWDLFCSLPEQQENSAVKALHLAVRNFKAIASSVKEIKHETKSKKPPKETQPKLQLSTVPSREASQKEENQHSAASSSPVKRPRPRPVVESPRTPAPSSHDQEEHAKEEDSEAELGEEVLFYKRAKTSAAEDMSDVSLSDSDTDDETPAALLAAARDAVDFAPFTGEPASAPAEDSDPGLPDYYG